MQIIAIVIIGVIIGLSSGMFGIGGALVATPLLKTFTALTALQALASPLPAALPSAISGSFVYAKNKLIHWKLCAYVIIFALPFNIAGSLSTKLFGGDIMMWFTGAFMTFIGAMFFIRGWMLKESDEANTEIKEIKIYKAALVGVAAGFLSGFLAIGGGMIMVPAFIKVFKMKMKSALATSLLCVAILSIPGTIVHYIIGNIEIVTSLILCAIVAPFANIGAKLAVKLPNKVLEFSYGSFMIIFAIIFLFFLKK